MKRKRPTHQWQLKKPDPNWVSSDERDITAVYVELAQKGQLDRFVQLRKQYEKLYVEWQAAWDLLIQTGKAPWLDKFSLQCRRQEKDFKKTLESYISKLDQRRFSLREKMQGIARSLRRIDKSIPIPFHVDEGTRTTNVGTISSADLGVTTDAAVGHRNFLIRRHSALPNEDLCKRLDLELLLISDKPPLGLPETWEKHGIKTYAEAYANKKTRGLVQKLIADVKGRL